MFPLADFGDVGTHQKSQRVTSPRFVKEPKRDFVEKLIVNVLIASREGTDD